LITANRPVDTRDTRDTHVGSIVSSRYRDRDFRLRRLLLTADLCGIVIALFLALLTVGYHEDPLLEGLWVLLTLPVWGILFRVYGLYDRQMRRFEPTRIDDLWPLFHALIVGTLALWLAYKLLPPPSLILNEVLVFGAAAGALIVVLRIALRELHLRIHGPERVFVVGDAETIDQIDRKLRNHPEYHMCLVGAMALDCESGDQLPARSPSLPDVRRLAGAGQLDHVIFQPGDALTQEEAWALMQECHRANLRVSALPGIRSLLRPGVEFNQIEGIGFLSYQPPVLTRSSRFLKRGFDLVVGALMLLFFAPLMALIAVAIKLDTRGTVLFGQTRVGRHGRRFRLVKFRTMVVDADTRIGELMGGSSDPDWLLIEDDPRVTRVGRFLRQTSLDELPQLWNVLRGEMSLVGPRPLSERDDQGVVGWSRHRLDLVPGVTGPWQVLGRTSIPFQEMVDLDYDYVTNWSLPRDLKVLLQTVPAVLRGRGAN
jgi:exopolysaccharide biosynthesis polyprenyl glycosylphosphotransferase